MSSPLLNPEFLEQARELREGNEDTLWLYLTAKTAGFDSLKLEFAVLLAEHHLAGHLTDEIEARRKENEATLWQQIAWKYGEAVARDVRMRIG